MRRADLQRILTATVLDAGAGVRLGVSVESLGQDANGVDVFFTDGTADRFDLVVGR